VKLSPKRATARATVTTGSHVLMSEALAAPMRGRPARKREIAIMVGISAIASTTAQPPAVAGRASSPCTPAMIENAMPAPVMMTAAAPTAGTSFITLSPSRM